VDIADLPWQRTGTALVVFAHETDVVCRRLLETTAEKVTESMTAATTFARSPLVISAGNLTAGPVQATFRDGDRESLLHNYLVLVRRMRGQLREPTITLRNADISALADHLGASQELVLDDLLDRMGATRAQRKALLAMFAVGALSIVATGSVALELSSAGALAEGSLDAPPAAETVELVASSAPVATAPSEIPVLEVVAPATTAVAPAVAAPDAELPIGAGGDDWEYTLSLHQLTQALAIRPAAQAALAGTEGVGVADDGSAVAVGQPPVPPTEGVGVGDDGFTVAVAQPPMPADGIGVADDGSVVGVAPPPVP